MNTHDLNQKIAVVTGSAQGIGNAVAERLAAFGTRPFLSDVNAGARAPAAELPRARRSSIR